MSNSNDNDNNETKNTETKTSIESNNWKMEGKHSKIITSTTIIHQYLLKTTEYTETKVRKQKT